MTVRDSAAGAFDLVWRQLDRIVSPATRKDALDSARTFAEARPLLASFLLIQLLFSFLPVLLFASFALSIVAFVVAAALAFSLFWVGAALLVLVPILLVAAAAALAVWAWAAASFVVARRVFGALPTRDSVSGETAQKKMTNKAEIGPVVPPSHGVVDGEGAGVKVEKTDG